MITSFSAGTIPSSAVAFQIPPQLQVMPDILQIRILSVGTVPALNRRAGCVQSQESWMHALGSKMGEKEKESVWLLTGRTLNVLPGEEARLTFDYLIYLLIKLVHLS